MEMWIALLQTFVHLSKAINQTLLMSPPTPTSPPPWKASLYHHSFNLNFLHLDPYNGDYEYLLVITDHFASFTQAYSATNKSAKSAAIQQFPEVMQQFSDALLGSWEITDQYRERT